MEEEIALALIAVAATLMLREKKSEDRRGKNRSCWVRPWLQRRDQEKDSYSLLMKELRVEDPLQFRNFVRMDSACFDKLLSFIEPNICRKDTVMREAISPSPRLAVTLRFLATGESYKSFSFAHRISVASLSKLIIDVCREICNSLRNKYLKAPTTEGEWLKIAADFDELWQFPNCIGAMDGKHISFAPPRSAGSQYYNYKKFNSIVLLAVVDAHYRFRLVDIGCNGRVSDGGGGVLINSKISAALRENWLNIPQAKALKCSNITVQHVIVADDAFRLEPHIMKPYRDCGDDKYKKVFNYRLSRSRRGVENAFGILANRFRILLGTIRLPVEKVELIVKTLCILHYFLIDQSDGTYLLATDVENTELCIVEEGGWRLDAVLPGIPQQSGNRTSCTARDVRDMFCTYFNSNGFVPWQWESIKKFNY